MKEVTRKYGRYNSALINGLSYRATDYCIEYPFREIPAELSLGRGWDVRSNTDRKRRTRKVIDNIHHVVCNLLLMIIRDQSLFCHLSVNSKLMKQSGTWVVF